MRRGLKCRISSFQLLAAVLFLSISAQSTPCATDIPSQYKKFFVKNSEGRAMPTDILVKHGIGDQEIGRSYALIAGISDYPKLPDDKKSLPQAKVDIDQIVQFLTQNEYFDEIVVLRNQDVTLDNLNYFLGVYFPERMSAGQNSRFLFAYSGHGFDDDDGSYLLSSLAEQMNDRVNSIDLAQLKIAVEKSVSKALNALVLINSCQGGAFLDHIQFGGDASLIYPKPGAHAITAGAKGQPSYASGSMGRGSYFFEEVLRGLGGAADTNDGGLITADELYSFVRKEVETDTNGDQDPQFGDIEPHTSQGVFFFVRAITTARGVAPRAAVAPSHASPANALGPTTRSDTAFLNCDGALTVDFYSYAIANNLQDDFLRSITSESWQSLKEAAKSNGSALFSAGKAFLGGNYSLDDSYALFDQKRAEHFKLVYYSRSYDQAVSILQSTIGTREFPAYSTCLRSVTSSSPTLRIWAAHETLDEIELHVRYTDSPSRKLSVSGQIVGGSVAGAPQGQLWSATPKWDANTEHQFTIVRGPPPTQTVVTISSSDNTISMSRIFARADGILTTTYAGTGVSTQPGTRRISAHTPNNNENRGNCPNEVGRHDGKYCTSRTTLTLTTSPPHFLTNAKLTCAGAGCPWTSAGDATVSPDGLTATAYLDNWGSDVDAILTADEFEHISTDQCGTNGSVPALRNRPVLIGVRRECLPVAIIKWTLLPNFVEGILKFGEKSSASGEVVLDGSLVQNSDAVFASYSIATALDPHYQPLFLQYQANEAMLAQLSEEAFSRLDYAWTIKFLDQARAVESSRVWQRDYPLLAAAELLGNGDRNSFKSTLQEMLAAMRLNSSYLHHSATIGFVLQNLSNIRPYVDKDAQDYIDNTIVPAVIAIKKTVST